MKDDKGLAKRSFKAASWVLIAQFSTQFIQLLLGICMVRLLSPKDYGILGMLAIFWAVSNVFISGGFSLALIQRKEITQTDLCSVFYYNMLLSLLCCFIMIGASHWIAEFYNQPILEKTIKVTAWTLPISALGSVQSILLSRDLKQGFITISGLIAVIISGIAALILAWKGYGVWALVWRGFIASLCTTIIVFSFSRWIPRLIFSITRLKELFGFGSKLMLSGLLNNIYNHINSVVIGKFYPVETLGYYERAHGYVCLWPMSIQSAISQVLFPAFSKIQDDKDRLKKAFKRSLAISIFVVVFPSFMLCVLCRPFIELILTAKWLPCIPYWWLLTCTICLWPIHVLNLEVLKSIGRSDIFFKLEILKKCLSTVSLFILIFAGIFPMLIAGIFCSLISAYLNSFYVGKYLSYSLFQQFKDIGIYFILSMISCTALWLVYHFTYPLNQWCGFILAVITGLVCYLTLNRLLLTSAFTDLHNLIPKRFMLVRYLLFIRD